MRSMIQRAGLALALVASAAVYPAAGQQAADIHIVDIHVNLESENQSIGGSISETSRFSMAFKKGPAYELAARVLPGRPQTVAITVFRNDSPTGSGEFRRVESVQARVGVPTPLTSIRAAAVVVERVRTAPRRTAQGRPSSFLRGSRRTTPEAAWDAVASPAGTSPRAGALSKRTAGIAAATRAAKPPL